MKRRLLIGSTLAVLLVAPATVVAGPDGAATAQFGRPDTGSPFPPPTFDHDQSSNARDNMTPRTVVIAEGGSVTFEIYGRHQPRVYLPGTTPADIDVPASGQFVNEPDGLAAEGALAPLGVVGQTTTWTFDGDTFSAPGRYLVICNVRPHFADFDMYGWVVVK